MSQAHVRDLSGSKAEQGLDALLDDLPGLLSSAASQYVKLLRRSSKLVGDLLPIDQLSRSNDCCSVPTQDCPPRCIAEICWDGCACEVQRATVTVKNSGAQTRTFSFVAGNLGSAKVEVAPPAATLAPGQAVTLQVAVPANQGLKDGETYSSELLIRGAYEQCVRLRLRVASAAAPHLDLCQGEVPEKITELNWYRHWQCTDPCANERTPNDNPGTVVVGSHVPAAAPATLNPAPAAAAPAQGSLSLLRGAAAKKKTARGTAKKRS
jgi:hypothetical protein